MAYRGDSGRFFLSVSAPFDAKKVLRFLPFLTQAFTGS
jgi:hypothetical protein